MQSPLSLYLLYLCILEDWVPILTGIRVKFFVALVIVLHKTTVWTTRTIYSSTVGRRGNPPPPKRSDRIWGPPSLCIEYRGLFYRWEISRGVKPTNHPRLAPQLKYVELYLHFACAFVACTTWPVVSTSKYWLRPHPCPYQSILPVVAIWVVLKTPFVFCGNTTK
jgi:hypothetical protein